MPEKWHTSLINKRHRKRQQKATIWQHIKMNENHNLVRSECGFLHFNTFFYRQRKTKREIDVLGTTSTIIME